MSLSLEMLTSRRRVEGVVVAEQRRLHDLGISSYADVHMRGCEVRTEADASALKPGIAERFLRFLRDR